MLQKRKKRVIVDNKKFTEELSKYVEEFKKLNPDNKKPYNRPKASDYLGRTITLLAKHLATLNNFSGYTWKEEMIGDGIEAFLRYMHNFDPEKTNAHAYATMIMKNAFIHRIKRENKQSYVKNKIIRNMDMSAIYETQDSDDSEYDNGYVETMQKIAFEGFANTTEGREYSVEKKERKKAINNNEYSIESFFGE